MNLTIDKLPDEIERALLKRASAEHKSLDEAVVDALARGLAVEPQNSAKIRDLSDIAGTWVVDPESEAILEEQGTLKRRDLTGIAGLRLIDDEMKAAFEEQRRIDPQLWK